MREPPTCPNPSRAPRHALLAVFMIHDGFPNADPTKATSRLNKMLVVSFTILHAWTSDWACLDKRFDGPILSEAKADPNETIAGDE